MEAASIVMVGLIAVVGLGLAAWLCYRLLRWARSSSSGAQALGAVLTEVTQNAVVHDAKQGRKRSERDAGDPPNETEERTEALIRGADKPDFSSRPRA
jgi:hypothetical protein